VLNYDSTVRRQIRSTVRQKLETRKTLDPDSMIPIETASYVMVSSAQNTMTMKSKIAFADKAAVEQFASSYRGQVVGFKVLLPQQKWCE